MCFWRRRLWLCICFGNWQRLRVARQRGEKRIDGGIGWLVNALPLFFCSHCPVITLGLGKESFISSLPTGASPFLYMASFHLDPIKSCSRFSSLVFYHFGNENMIRTKEEFFVKCELASKHEESPCSVLSICPGISFSQFTYSLSADIRTVWLDLQFLNCQIHLSKWHHCLWAIRAWLNYFLVANWWVMQIHFHRVVCLLHDPLALWLASAEALSVARAG